MKLERTVIFIDVGTRFVYMSSVYVFRGRPCKTTRWDSANQPATAQRSNNGGLTLSTVKLRSQTIYILTTLSFTFTYFADKDPKIVKNENCVTRKIYNFFFRTYNNNNIFLHFVY